MTKYLKFLKKIILPNRKNFYRNYSIQKHWMEKETRFSYVEMKANVSRSFLNQTSTYGFDFELVTDPLGTTSHTYARVLFVLPDSPASEAGLQRGDWISAVGDAQINVNNYGYLISGDATTLTRKSIIAGEDDYIWDRCRCAFYRGITSGGNKSVLYQQSI